jgi:hypothetical protein
MKTARTQRTQRKTRNLDSRLDGEIVACVDWFLFLCVLCGSHVSSLYFDGSTKTAVPYASTSVTPCMTSVAS